MNRAAQQLGRRGGRKTSEAKAAAAKANGAKGGRPRKSPKAETHNTAGSDCPAATCSRSSRLWEIDHPYYCNESNYFAKGSEQPHMHFDAWSSFLAEYGDADMDYNFLIRWDWDEEEERAYTGDAYYRNGVLKLFWMGQRKGLYQWATVEVCRADEPAVRDYLQTRWDYMRKMWEPFSCENAPASDGRPQTRQTIFEPLASADGSGRGGPRHRSRTKAIRP